MRAFFRIAVAVSLLSSLWSASVFSKNTSLVLEEIIVTATKREQSMQDVAVAVSAIGAEFIEKAQLISSESLTELVPSLNLQKGSNVRQTSFSIRGIGTQSFSSAVEPSVSTMVDGVVMGRSGQAFMNLLDVQRVEVLRGPQGSLFGKNSTAGVVHIISKDPTEEFSGELMTSGASNEEYRAGLTLSGPISDDFGYRLSLSGTDVEGYTRNYLDGDDLNGRDNWSARLKFRWDVSDNLVLKWSSDYYEQECFCTVSPIRSLEPFNGNEAAVQTILDRINPVIPGEENDEVFVNSIPNTENSQWGHSLEAAWELGDYTLTSITSFRGFDIEGKSDGDLDGQPISSLGFSQGGRTTQEQFTQELRISSPADRAVNYVAGLFFFDQEVDRTFTRAFEIVPDLPGIGIATFAADTTNWAAFGELSWSIADQWQLVLGGRYTQDDLEFVYERTQEGFTVGLPAAVPSAGQSTDETDFSGKVALQWDLNESSMVYASFVQGYKGPAYDLTFGTDPLTTQRIEPETSDAWELGLKSQFWDDRIRLNVAVFDATYKGFQSQAFLDPDGPSGCPPEDPGCNPDDDPGSFLLINAGEVRTRGIEVDLLAQLSENLRLSGALAWLDAEIVDYPAGNCSDGQKFRGECPDEGLQDLSGGQLPFTPDLKLNLAATYTWATDKGFDVDLRGSVRYQDDVQYSLSQDRFSIGDAYTILNASLALRSQNDKWNTTLFVKNLTDEFYPSFIFTINSAFLPNGYFHRYSNIAERTVGLEFRYRW